MWSTARSTTCASEWRACRPTTDIRRDEALGRRLLQARAGVLGIAVVLGFGRVFSHAISLQPGTILFGSESEEVAIGPDVHQLFHEGGCGGDFFADDVASENFQLFRAGIDDDNRAGV